MVTNTGHCYVVFCVGLADFPLGYCGLFVDRVSMHLKQNPGSTEDGTDVGSGVIYRLMELGNGDRQSLQHVSICA